MSHLIRVLKFLIVITLLAIPILYGVLSYYNVMLSLEAWIGIITLTVFLEYPFIEALLFLSVKGLKKTAV